MSLPLKGIKVLDLTKVLAGPQCAMYLADMGADVIKVETPLIGDDTRGFGPFKNGESSFYQACNRNKKSVTINLKEPLGLEILYKLVQDADIVMENMLTGVAEKLKIDYQTLKEIKPDIIYCSISGFGRTGPYAQKGGYDMLGQAFGGLMSVTGPNPEAPPVRVGFSAVDIATGIISCMAILAALIDRNATGKGQHVCASLLQSACAIASYQLTTCAATGFMVKPNGTRHAAMAPYQAYKANNGHFIIGLSNPKQWEKLTAIPRFAFMRAKPHYDEMANRVKNIDELEQDIESVTAHMTVQEVCDLLDECGIPNSPINNLQDMLNNEYIRNELLMSFENEKMGTVVVPKIPFTSNRFVPEFKNGAPNLGEHTDEVLADIGYSHAEVANFKNMGIV